jgi:hypothetical protein
MAIFKLPAGITPDATGAFGTFAALSNANNYSETYVTVVTAGTNSALTAVQALSGGLFLTAGASGAFTLTLPTTNLLLAALGPTIPTDGTYSEPLWITNNNVGQTATLTIGDSSTTLSGTMTIATNTTRKFLLNVTGSSTITIYNQGSMSL